MMDYRRILANRRGSALLLGLGVMVLLGLLTTALLPWITAEARFGRNDQDAVQARYAAEAGVKRALAEFGLPGSKDWSWLNIAQQLTDTPGQATYTVSISPDPAVVIGGEYTITSEGAAGPTGKVMTRVSKMPKVLYKAGGVYTTYAGGILNIGGTTEVKSGTIGYFYDLNTKNNVPPQDLVTCPLSTCPVTNPTCCIVKATATLPTFNQSDYLSSPAPPTSWAYNVPNLTQIKYYSSTDFNTNQLIWQGRDGVNTVVFINGNADFKNGATITAGKNGAILIYAIGNIIFQNNSTLKGVAVIAGGNIDLQNNTTVDGALIAKGNVQFNNNAISYNANVVSALNLTTFTSFTSSVKATTWEK